MEFKQSASILISNFSLVFKLFLYILVITLIVAAIGVGIVSPIVKLFMSEEAVGGLISNTKDDVNAFLKGDVGLYDTFYALKNDVIAFANYIISLDWFIAGIVVVAIFVYLVYLFLFTLSSIPIADIINNSMASNLKYGFLSNFAMNFRRSVKYSFIKVLIFLPIDLVIFGVLFGLTYGLWKLFKTIAILQYFSLAIILVLGLLLASLRQTLFSGWIPRLIFHPEEGIITALKKSMPAVKNNAKVLIMSYVSIYFVLYFFVTVVGLFTFGLMSILAPSLSYVILRIVELVSYYRTNKLKFYTDALTVVDTTEYGMREEEQLTPEQIVVKERRLNANIREVSYDPTQEEILANPSFYEALKLGMSGELISSNTLQIRLGISSTLAKAIIKTMNDLGYLKSKTKFGTKKVVISQEEYDRLLLGDMGNVDKNDDDKK